MPPLVEDWSGQVIADGRFRVVSRLGEGGMGFVYQALDLRLDTDVVIKVPHPDLLSKPDIARRFLREGKSLVKLNHPHIVNILDVGEHERLPYIVMQFLGGGDLSDRLKTHRDNNTAPVAADVIRWLQPIASALDFVHARGYVHRDIKPANILFDEFDHPYLSDFGIIKGIEDEVMQHTSRLTSTGMAVGTPDYMAPELIMGGQITGAADQYALAIVVFESLCGCLPFDGGTVGAIMVQHANAIPPDAREFNESIPANIAEALAKALGKNPEERFPNVVEMIDSLTGGEAAQSMSSTKIETEVAETAAAPTSSIAKPDVPTQSARKADCPNCSTRFTVTSKLINKSARCPKCKAKLYIDAELNVSLNPQTATNQLLKTQEIESVTTAATPDVPVTSTSNHATANNVGPKALRLLKSVFLLARNALTVVTRPAILLASKAKANALILSVCLVLLFCLGLLGYSFFGIGSSLLSHSSSLESQQGVSGNSEPKRGSNIIIVDGEEVALPIAIQNPGEPEVHNLMTKAVHKDIQSAIDAANRGDILMLTEGIYPGAFRISKEVKIQAYTGNVVIDGEGADKIITVEQRTELRNLIITNGRFAIDMNRSGNTYTCSHCVVSDCETAFSINQSQGRNGNARIFHSIVIDCGNAININDGGTVEITNSILDNVGTAYVCTNGRGIIPRNILFHNVKTRVAGNNTDNIRPDKHELVGNPMFVDPRAENLLKRNYKVRDKSPAVDTGIKYTTNDHFQGWALDRGIHEDW